MGSDVSVGSLLQDSMVVWRRAWFSQSVLCFLVFCPLVILEALKVNVSSQLVMVFGYLYHFVVFSILPAAMMHLVIMFARNQPTDIQEAIDLMSAKSGELLPPLLYVGGKVILGCLLIIPGLIWVYKYMFVSLELLFGARSRQEAMANSARLTDGYKWKMFWVHVCFLIGSALVGLVLGLTLGHVTRPAGSLSEGVVFFMVQYLFTSVISALSVTFFSLLYLERRREVYGHSVPVSVKTLMKSVSSAQCATASELTAKYKDVSQQLSASRGRRDELILRS